MAESDRGMAGGLRFDHFVRLFAGDSQRFDQSPFLDAWIVEVSISPQLKSSNFAYASAFDLSLDGARNLN